MKHFNNPMDTSSGPATESTQADDGQARFHHAFSNGADARNFIICEADAFAAFNRIGICAARHPKVRIASATVEDTHIHALLHGVRTDCEAWCRDYEWLTTKYTIASRRSRDGLRIFITLEPITDESYLMNAAAYTIIQPTKDGKRIMPYDYLWGTGPMYFRDARAVLPWLIGEGGQLNIPSEIGLLPRREQNQVLHSKKEVPGNWLICNGFLLPCNYIDVALFESIFKTHNCFRSFLSNSRKESQRVVDSMAAAVGISLEDSEARQKCQALCLNMFGSRDVRTLNSQQRLRLATALRSTHGISFRQVATLVHLPEEEVRQFVR